MAALAALVLVVPVSTADAATGVWKRQASYAYQSWCTGAGKFWVTLGGTIRDYRCIHYPDRAWAARWALDLYRVY